MSIVIFNYHLTIAVPLILQYERRLYYLQEMAPYDDPLRSELLGGKFTILVCVLILILIYYTYRLSHIHYHYLKHRELKIKLV